MGHNFTNLHVLDLEFVELLFTFLCVLRCWLCMRSTKCHWTTSSDILILQINAWLFILKKQKTMKSTHLHPSSAVKQNKLNEFLSESWNLQLPAVNSCYTGSLLNGHCVFCLIELAHLYVCLNILTRHMVATLPCLHVQGSLETWI